MNYYQKLSQPAACPFCNHEYSESEFNDAMNSRSVTNEEEINIKEVTNIECPDCHKSAILDVISETDDELIAVIHE